MVKIIQCLLMGALCALSFGCDTLHFYQQAVWGQVKLLHARQDLAKVRADAGTDPSIAERLAVTQNILAFAEREMGLAQGGRYTSYVQLDSEYVVWNVFAAPSFSLSAKQWCYPIVGCAPYRGYFKQADAQRAARKYANQGLETYVGGVPAYSTLGWFDDPLLSSFILWPDADLANLLIHEIAHQRVWVRSDAVFNENFAEFVGNEGTKAWLVAQDREDAWMAWMGRRAQWQRFRAFLLDAKAVLEVVYQREDPEEAKVQALAGIQQCYLEHRDALGKGRFDALMEDAFNNAFLVSVGTYADWLPGFAALFAQHNHQWPAFFDAVDTLALMDEASRHQAMDELTAQRRGSEEHSLSQQDVAQRRDHQNAHQIHCQTFSNHGLHGKAPT